MAAPTEPEVLDMLPCGCRMECSPQPNGLVKRIEFVPCDIAHETLCSLWAAEISEVIPGKVGATPGANRMN